jgi:hypothetical protein
VKNASDVIDSYAESYPYAISDLRQLCEYLKLTTTYISFSNRKTSHFKSMHHFDASHRWKLPDRGAQNYKFIKYALG